MAVQDKKLNTANLDTLSATFALSLAETDKLVASWLNPSSSSAADKNSDDETDLTLELKSVYSRSGLGSNDSNPAYPSRNVGSAGGLGSENGTSSGSGAFANKALDALRRKAEKEARFKLRAKANGVNVVKSKYPQKIASTKVVGSDSEDEGRGGKSSQGRGSIQSSNSMVKKKIMSRSANFLDEYKKSKKKKSV